MSAAIPSEDTDSETAPGDAVLRERATLRDFARAFESAHPVVGIWLVLGLGALLRFITLGKQSLWLDEAISYWTVNRPFPDLMVLLRNSPRPLHFLILHPVVALGGEEWLLRLPSALAGLASIGLIYALGRELFDRKTGLLTALILALSPFHIWYSQEARFYATLAFLGLAAGFFAFRALRWNRPVDWALFGACEGLALWTETGAIWFVIAMNVAASLMIRSLWRTGRFPAWGASQAIALLIYLPILPNTITTLGEGGPLWIPPATLRLLARTTVDFAGSFMRTTIESRLVLIVLLAGLAAGAAGMAREVRRAKGFELERYLVLASWLAVPVGLSFLLSQRYFHLPFFSLVFDLERSVFLTRNLILASFPLYLLLARSLVLARSPWRTSVLTALVLLNLYAYYGNALVPRKDDFRSAAAFISERVQKDEVILFSPPYLETPFAYYYYLPNGLLGEGYPRAVLEDGVISGNLWRIYASPLEALSPDTNVWLVYTENEFQQDHTGTREALKARRVLENTWHFEGLIVQYFTEGMAR